MEREVARAGRAAGAVIVMGMGLGMMGWCWPAAVQAQTPPQPQAQQQLQAPAAPLNDALEQRRADERGQQLRRQEEARPDIHLQPPAQQAPERLATGQTPCSRIDGIALDGQDAASFQWLLESVAFADLNRTVPDAPQGQCLGTQGIELLRQRAQAALQAAGYVTSRVLLQTQDLAAGRLTLTLLAGRVRGIRLAGDAAHATSLRAAMPLRAGDILDLRDIEQALENLRRVPGTQAGIDIAPAEGAAPGESDLVVNYAPGKPWRLSLSADDSGTRATGRHQGAVTLSLLDPLALNDLFYVSLSHGLDGQGGTRGTSGATLHYSLPVGYWLIGATASRNRYHQTVAGASQDYVYSGISQTQEARLSRVIHRDADSKATLSLAAFRRASASFIDDTEIAVQHRVVGGYEIALGERMQQGNATLEANIAYRRGTGAFGAQPAPEEPFGEGTSRFALLAADASASVPFALGSLPVRYSANWRIQAPRTPLTPQDRFAIGGRYTVRGFDGESNLSAARGWLLRNELATPLGDSAQEVYAALDHGEVGGAGAQLLAGRRLTGFALGLRGAVQSLQYELFVGAPLAKPHFMQTARTTAGFQLNFSY